MVDGRDSGIIGGKEHQALVEDAGRVQVGVVGVQARGGDLFHQAAPEILFALLI